ncbi:MAG TPA: amino acid adenylation domain-containing protein [Candidatus Acidoferrum sp.]|nr:amino acid adenylation domain-containing protein [Candidatus Acidoferrum sp.]
MSELNVANVLPEWSRFNETITDFPEKNLCIHQVIEERAKETPDKVAIDFHDRQLTYREFNERANQLARVLRRKGVGPEVIIGILMERSPEMVIAMVATFKAGGAYIALEPLLPQERLQLLIDDSQPRLLLVEQAFQRLVQSPKPENLIIDREWPNIAREEKQNLPTEQGPDNIAYIIYTSGSTGRPKGIEVTHRNLVAFMHTMRVEPGLTKNDRFLAFTTVTFDICAAEFLCPLMIGAQEVIASSKTSLSWAALFAYIEEKKVTFMEAAPTYWRLYVEMGWQGSKRLKIVSAGEYLHRDLADQLMQRVGELWNIWGPAETTIWNTTSRVQPGEGPPTIGHNLPNNQTYILDEHMKPVVIGEIGELYVGGDQVARGYLRKPDLTAERFVPNPFPNLPSARLYRTGDLGLYLPDGEMHFHGRVDNQIKIQGVRMEPEEIESAIMQHPGIRQAIVIAREDIPGEKYLVGYLTLENGFKLQVPEMRAFLLKKLPRYMVPMNFVTLERYPLTANGKINRKALPRPGPIARASAD